jgi:phosphohistidine swiveling domain-containing protein
MAKINLNNIAKYDWISRWAGSYTFISCSFWGYQYTQSIKKILGQGFDHVLFIHRKGTVSFYVSKKELFELGAYLVRKIKNNKQSAIRWLNELKKNTDIITPLMKKLEKKIPTVEEFENFYKYFDRHLAFHVFMKKTVDFLPAELMDELLPFFREARLYSENVYSDTESFFRKIAKQISKKEGYNSNYLTCLDRNELTYYLASKKLPQESVLKKRFLSSALYFSNKPAQEVILLGRKVDGLEKLMFKSAIVGAGEKLKGIPAYRGQVKGVCRIVLDPFKVGKFNKGDILVTGMTRPEFLSLIKKSSAIITDVGGTLCHAAIAAREFKKPCVVGTAVATKVLKDGDFLEIDAVKGIVKKIT